MKTLVCIVAAAFVAGVLIVRPKPTMSDSRPAAASGLSVEAGERIKFPPPDPGVQGNALHDHSLRNLIANARVASLQGDQATRAAMIRGLRAEPDRSRVLLKEEISGSTDPSVVAALTQILSELP